MRFECQRKTLNTSFYFLHTLPNREFEKKIAKIKILRYDTRPKNILYDNTETKIYFENYKMVCDVYAFNFFFKIKCEINKGLFQCCQIKTN